MPDNVTREATRLLWDFVYAYDAAYDRAARSVDLSAAQACLLKAVAVEPRPMGELATELLCDASNVTQIAARLEARGLVERVVPATDRRSRHVRITAAGAPVAEEADAAFTFPGERVERLSHAEQQTLVRLLQTMLRPEEGTATAPKHR